MEVLNDGGDIVARLMYDYGDIVTFNGVTVHDGPVIFSGNDDHRMVFDTDAQTVTAWIAGTGLDATATTQDFLKPMGADELGGIRFEVVYYDTAANPRAAGVGFDDMVVRTITEVREPEVCGDLGTVYLPADLNEDCDVNLLDLVMFVDPWLHCSDPEVMGCDQYWK